MSHYFHQSCMSCGFVFVFFNQHQAQTPEEAPPLSTPEFRAAVRVVKKANAARNKGLVALRKAVHAAALGFKAQSAPLVASLKAMKREAMAETKLTTGWRAGVLGARRATAVLNHFKKQYVVSYETLRALGLRQRWRWRTRPAHIIRRKFRVKI